MKITNGYSTNGPFCVQQRPWTPTKRRGPISAEFQTPGPADIALPSTFGPQQKDTTRAKSPAFTFAGKHEEKNKFLTPGPGSYEVSGVNRTGKENQTGPTISGRHKEPEPYKTPAPGDYTPEKCEKTVLNASPAYSFGLKAKDLKPDTIPAPGAYDPEKSIKNVLDNRPSYSFGLKPKDPKIDDIPAPGAYSPEKVEKSVHQSPPSFSFGVKHKDPKPENIPAPGAYSPEKSEKALNNAPSYTFGGKYKDPKPDDVPAPNSYNIPDMMAKDGPSYSIGGKDGNLWATNNNPGPGSYNVPGAEISKQKSPAYTIRTRTYMPGDKTQKPGPGAHSPEKVVMNHTPAFTFGIRHSPFAHGFNKDTQMKMRQIQQKTIC